MKAPGEIAIGTWSGGRFMHFGEEIAEERLVDLLRPGRGIDTVITADVYGRGELTACWERRWAASTGANTALRARSATTSMRVSATGPRGFRASPTRACAARTSTPATCEWRPSAAWSGWGPSALIC